MDASDREFLIAGASRLGVALDADAVGHFSRYLALLQLWGKRINLTTRLETREVLLYHFLDSLAGYPWFADSPAARVVDLGAGAGLPSLPLKFALPRLHVLLVESVRKKVAFCSEVIRATGVSGIEAVWGRGEALGIQPGIRGAFDWAVSRALGSSADVAKLAHPFLAPGGRLLLYKGDPAGAELRELDSVCTESGAAWEHRQITVPGLSAARSFVIVTFP